MQMRYLAALHTDGVSSADGGRVYGDDPALSTGKRSQFLGHGAFACFANNQRLNVSRLPRIWSVTCPFCQAIWPFTSVISTVLWKR